MKNQVRFTLILLIAFIGRLTLIEAGFLNDLDEYLFVWIQKHDGHLMYPSFWFKAVNEVQAQLPELFIRSIQYKIMSWLSPNESCLFSIENLKWMGVFNALTVVIQAIVFRKIILTFFQSIHIADLMVALWLVFANTNLYCRHILPYDHSLLFWLIAIYLSISSERKKHWLSGVFAALGILTYWGSIPALFFYSFSVIQRYKSKEITPFVLPFFLLLIGVELLAQLHQFSYLHFLISYQTTIHTGNYDEGYVFPFYYLYHVENILGVVLLPLFLGSIFLILKDKNREASKVVYPAVFSLILFSTLVYFAHIFVWYGRVIHFLLPFIVLSSFKMIDFLVKQKFVLWGAFASLIALYFFQLKSWDRIEYPRNFIEKYASDNSKMKFEFETKVGLRLDKSPFLLLCFQTKKSKCEQRLLFVNTGFLMDYPTSKILNSKHRIKIPNAYKLVKKGLHFQSHPFYQFEYNDRIGRNYFEENQFNIQLYCDNPQWNKNGD